MRVKLKVNSWGFKLKKTFGKQSFRYLFKIKFGQKIFPQNHPRPQKAIKSRIFQKKYKSFWHDKILL